MAIDVARARSGDARVEAKLLQNLAGGLRLLAFLPIDNRCFAPSLRQAICLGALSGAIWVGLDWLALGSAVNFAWSSVAQISWIALTVVSTLLLLLLLTSHGTEEGKLVVRHPGWPLRDLTPAALDAALRAAGIKWRIIIVSACYSGSFIGELENEFSLIVTAARADRKSFGCRPSRELTYFGEALFRDALPYSNTLQEAVARAALLVATRERAEQFTPSEPQVSLGKQMRGKLAQLSLSR